MNQKKLKPYNAVIQVCPYCNKVDVSKGHEKNCNPAEEQIRRESQDYLFKT